MATPKLIFIGTVHAGFTNNNQLLKLIKNYQPVKLLIEIKQMDVKSGNIDSYPPEMIAAYGWAIDNKIPIVGIDHDTDEVIFGNEELIKKLATKQIKVLEGHDWKKFNNKKNLDLLLTPEWTKIINKSETKRREHKMAHSIESAKKTNGNMVVITGSGHIPFFRKKFPTANFPLTTAK